MTKSEEQQPLSLQKALQQCELVQNMIDLSISNLEGLRTKCATSNDLTQKEIRTLEVGVARGGRAGGLQSFLPSPPLSPHPPPFPLILFVAGWGREGSERGTMWFSVIYLLAKPAKDVPSLYRCRLRLAGWW